MRYPIAALAFVFAALALCQEVKAEQRTTTLATLEWPPSTGSDLPKLGATTEVVRQAKAARGA